MNSTLEHGATGQRHFRRGAPTTGRYRADPVPGADEIAGRLAAAAQELSGADGPAWVVPSAWAEALYDPAVADIVRVRQLLRPEVLSPPDAPALQNEEPGEIAQ